VRAKRVLPWSKLAGFHALVLWQVWQVVPKPAAAWFGLVVAAYLAWWHERQSLGIAVYRPPGWHFAQSVRSCAPVSEKRVLLWSKFAGFHAPVLWQSAHCVENREAAWFGFVVAA
jgi:hypothetical protein